MSERCDIHKFGLPVRILSSILAFFSFHKKGLSIKFSFYLICINLVYPIKELSVSISRSKSIEIISGQSKSNQQVCAHLLPEFRIQLFGFLLLNASMRSFDVTFAPQRLSDVSRALDETFIALELELQSVRRLQLHFSRQTNDRTAPVDY